jgi:hypothetical protein
MRFSTEEDLETHCMKVLAANNIRAKRQVVVGSGRADIVTDQAVIEIKKVLDRQSIQQAVGQAIIYNRILKRKEIWIVGQMPSDWKDVQSAYKLAAEIGHDGEIVVSFVGDDEFWNEPISDGSDWLNGFNFNWQFIIYGLPILVVLLGVQSALSPLVQSKAIAPTSVDPFTTPSNGSSLNPSALSTQVYPNRGDRISACNGLPGGANFRVEPSMQGQVLSVLAIGSVVRSTGEVRTDGKIQFQKVIVGNQVGWVAQCFLDEQF